MHVVMVSSGGFGLSLPFLHETPSESFQEAQLNHQMHSFVTNVEGEWEWEWDDVSC